MKNNAHYQYKISIKHKLTHIYYKFIIKKEILKTHKYSLFTFKAGDTEIVKQRREIRLDKIHDIKIKDQIKEKEREIYDLCCLVLGWANLCCCLILGWANM